MFSNPFLADPAEVMMTTTTAQFDKILENGVAGAPITVGEYTAVPLFITTFGIGAGGGSVLGEAVGGGGGGGVIPCAVLVFGPDGVELKAMPHETTAAASQAVSRLVSDAATRQKRTHTVGVVETVD